MSSTVNIKVLCFINVHYFYSHAAMDSVSSQLDRGSKECNVHNVKKSCSRGVDFMENDAFEQR